MRDSVLTIDVRSEIRKLTKERFKSTGDYAVELVRWAAAQHPLRIDIEARGSRLTVTHDGTPPSQETVKRLVTVFDKTRSPSHRHTALVALEDSEELGLLAAFHPTSSRVKISGLISGRQRGVEFGPTGVATSFTPDSENKCVIVVSGRGRRPGLERKLIREACRHSLVPVILNGRRINVGPRLSNTLVHVDLRNARMHGTIGLPHSSDLTRIVRLRNGIRTEEKIRPAQRGMVFHAIVDEGDDDLASTWGTLRRAGRRLYQRLAKHFDEFDESQRSRALELLFSRYESTRDSSLLARVRAFRTLGSSPLDLAGVRELARDREIFALEPEQSPSGFDTEGRSVLLLDPRQRRFLEKELGADILPPPPCFRRLGLFRRLAISSRHFAKAVKRVFGGGPGRPIRNSNLDPEERAFLEIVSAEVRSGAFVLPGEARPFGIKIRMAHKQKPPWTKVERRDGKSEYRISRDNPLVLDVISAVTKDPSMIYPGLVALTDGHDGWVDTRAIHQQQILERVGV